MNNKDMAERTRQALKEFNELPPDEQIRILMKSTIDYKGRVFMSHSHCHCGKKIDPENCVVWIVWGISRYYCNADCFN